MIWAALKAEFDHTTVVYKLALQPVDSHAFLKHLITNKTAFPLMHGVLWCALVLAPANAVAHRALSQLTCLLSPQWLRISTNLKLVESSFGFGLRTVYPRQSIMLMLFGMTSA